MNATDFEDSSLVGFEDSGTPDDTLRLEYIFRETYGLHLGITKRPPSHDAAATHVPLGLVVRITDDHAAPDEVALDWYVR